MTRTYLKAYQPPSYLIPETQLDFHIISASEVRLSAQLLIKRRVVAPIKSLFLNGEHLQLKTIQLNGVTLDDERYAVMPTGLLIKAPPAIFTLTTTVVLNPQDNTSLAGLFVSDGVLCTQNEAEGFRCITYFLDRPDVLSRFIIRIRAAYKRYPVLLAGGEQRSAQRLADGEHCVEYEDPLPKPCYLMALVAGDLAVLMGEHRTRSGHRVCLEVYMDPRERAHGDFALTALKKALLWDEQAFGLEYDMDTYRIVAVNAFNFGAMENRGLNIFNAALVLATAETTSDEDYRRIETVVAHEYFHHWSGNRVTIRDWFQLTLKEGLTVYRDQEFTAALHSRAVKRIDDVQRLRELQFPEDAGPLAHPIRPQAYRAVDNFYTTTVYEKGAEVVRMLEVLLGRACFYQLLSQFLQKFAGMAVTIEEFLAFVAAEHAGLLSAEARLAASHIPAGGYAAAVWEQFKRWYELAGTPRVTVHEHYDQTQQTLSVTFDVQLPRRGNAAGNDHDKQNFGTAEAPVCPPQPLLIPLKWALLAPKHGAVLSEGVYLLNTNRGQLTFSELDVRPYCSIGREFSAPVKLERQWGLTAWVSAVQLETDAFMRWDALQQLMFCGLAEACRLADELGFSAGAAATTGSAGQNNRLTALSSQGSQLKRALLPRLRAACMPMLAETLTRLCVEMDDLAYVAKCLTLPSLRSLCTELKVMNLPLLVVFMQTWRELLLPFINDVCAARYAELSKAVSAESAPAQTQQAQAHRALQNALLALLVAAQPERYLPLAETQYAQAQLMNDRLAAFKLLMFYGTAAQRARVSADFYQCWQHNSLVMNQWLSAESSVPNENIFTRLQTLITLPVYQEKEPNKVYAVWSTFAHQNLLAFHHPSGKGYAALAEVILRIDPHNASVSTRLLTAYQHVHSLPAGLREQAERILLSLQAQLKSANACEIIQTLVTAI